jgi:hypothetical protein
MNAPTEVQRRPIFNRVLTVVDRKFMGANSDTAALRERHKSSVVSAPTKPQFEDAMNGMLRDLGASHVAVFEDESWTVIPVRFTRRTRLQ